MAQKSFDKTEFEKLVKSAGLVCILVDWNMYIVWKEGSETGWLANLKGPKECYCSDCLLNIFEDSYILEQVCNIELKVVAIGYEPSFWAKRAEKDFAHRLRRKGIAFTPLESSEIYTQFISACCEGT